MHSKTLLYINVQLTNPILHIVVFQNCSISDKSVKKFFFCVFTNKNKLVFSICGCMLFTTSIIFGRNMICIMNRLILRYKFVTSHYLYVHCSMNQLSSILSLFFSEFGTPFLSIQYVYIESVHSSYQQLYIQPQ